LLPSIGKQMTENINTTVPPVKTEIDLKSLAETVRRHHLQVVNAAASILDNAMAAGDALIAIEDSHKVRHGEWTSWIGRNCELSPRTARVYVQLARHRSELGANRQRAADLSLRGALRLIAHKKDGVGESPKPEKAAKSAAVLSTLAWSEATPEQRRHFLDGIGLISVLAAIPPAWHAEIDRRVEGQRKRLDCRRGVRSPAVVKALRQALSLQKAHGNKDGMAPGVAAALNVINNLLLKEGADLNEIEILLNKNLTRAKSAA
jgi:hypothetical protein